MTDRPDISSAPEDDALAERGRTLVAAATAEVRAPLRLREAVEAERARAGSRKRRGLAGRALAGVAGAAGAIVLAVALIGGGGTGAPDVLAVAGLSLRPAQAPAPEPSTGASKLLPVTVDGVSFPYWDDLRWDATGTRRDRVGGRSTATVYYRNAAGTRLGYTIVGGDALDLPAGRDVVRHGTRLRVTRHQGRTVVTWLRSGHTCVISAPAGVPEARVLALAAWTGKGQVDF